MSVCVCVCVCVCLCLNAGLTAAQVNLIFFIHTHIGSDYAIGYMILTFEVIKGHFRSKKYLCVVLREAIGEGSHSRGKSKML